jgi:LemA protein
MTVVYLLIGVAALLIFICIILANTVVGRKNQVVNVGGTLDALLKKRFDLIPNLVAAVKNYMKHERETLTNITDLRAKATGGGVSDGEKADISSRLGKMLSGLMVAVENYPELKANQNFLQLQAALNETEEQLSAARRAYNAAVTDYNNALEMFPTSVFGALLRYKPKPVFAAEESERANVNVGKMFDA